jgi:hypothetical protein
LTFLKTHAQTHAHKVKSFQINKKNKKNFKKISKKKSGHNLSIKINALRRFYRFPAGKNARKAREY